MEYTTTIKVQNESGEWIDVTLFSDTAIDPEFGFRPKTRIEATDSAGNEVLPPEGCHIEEVYHEPENNEKEV